MKKKVTYPDGTVVEYEGEPEELEELERGVRGSRRDENRKGGRRILNEERVAEMIDAALEDLELRDIHIYPSPYWWPTLPWYITVDGTSDDVAHNIVWSDSCQVQSMSDSIATMDGNIVETFYGSN